MEETWKDIKGFEDKYRISSNGNCFSIKYNKIMSPHITNSGYYQINLYKDGKPIPKLIHRLVAEAFLDNPDNLPEVNHKDENKLNNAVSNLEYCDRKYNQNYGTRTEKQKNKCSKPILQIKNGKIIREWESITQVENECGYKSSGIVKCCKLNNYSKYKGYTWRYKDEQ